MGNFAYLRGLGAVTSVVDESSIVRTSANSLPVLWLAAFEPTDRHTFILPLNGSVSIEVPALISLTSRAAERFAGRTPFLRQCLPAPLHAVLDSWKAWLDRVGTPFLGLDPSELSLMLQAQEIDSWLSDACSGFDDHSADKLVGAFDVNGLDFDPQSLRVVGYDDSIASVALTGF
jgi:hypothetical protein